MITSGNSLHWGVLIVQSSEGKLGEGPGTLEWGDLSLRCSREDENGKILFLLEDLLRIAFPRKKWPRKKWDFLLQNAIDTVKFQVLKDGFSCRFYVLSYIQLFP